MKLLSATTLLRSGKMATLAMAFGMLTLSATLQAKDRCSGEPGDPMPDQMMMMDGGPAFGDDQHQRKGKHEGRRGHHKGPHQMMKRVLSRLDLSDEQKAQLKTMRKSAQEQTQPMRQSLCELHQQMRKQMESDTIDPQQIKSLTGQIADIRAELLIEHLNKRQQFESILTEAQKAKLETIKAKIKARFDSEE